MAHHHPTMDITMNHTGIDHSGMNHTGMNPTGMNHTGMDQSTMKNHTGMDHSGMDHSGMDHSGMDHSGMDHSGMDNNGMGHMMKMYFNTDFGSYILFEDLQANTNGAMVGACFVIFAVAILYEGLKFVREQILQKSIQAEAAGRYTDTKIPAAASQEQMVMQTRAASVSNRMLSYGHFIQTALHVLQVFVSYCLMLVFMTYNVWLCLAVVLGAGVGYFLFGWKRVVVVDSNEHCH